MSDDATMPQQPDQTDLLLIAARAPDPGRTKTRLGATIGMARAAALYRAFLTDLAAQLAPGDAGYRLGWAFSPPDCDFAAIVAALTPGGDHAAALYVPQDGPDWSVRQRNLLQWGADHHYCRTVLVASDSPQLGRAAVAEAFARLREQDVVIGRVHDGGYYLIGLAGFHDVFSGVTMSTSTAADAVLARVSALGLRCGELPPTFDVDVEADLRALRDAFTADPTLAPATRRAMDDLDLW